MPKQAHNLSPVELTKLARDISVTERDQFKTCRRRWELEVLENFQPRIPIGTALDFGSGIHEALEAYYIQSSLVGTASYPKGPNRDIESAFMAWENWYNRAYDRLEEDEDVLDAQFEDLVTNLEELADLGEAMLEGYFRFAEHEDEFTVHAVEGKLTGAGQSWLKKHIDDREFISEHSQSAVILHPSGRLLCPILNPRTKRPLKGHPYLSTKIDLLVRDIRPGRNGIWIQDHKTASRIPDEAALEFFDQATAMCYVVWRWLGIVPRGVVWNYLFKRAPKEPRYGKKGNLSYAKDQLTTAEQYREALRKEGLMLKDGTVEDNRYAEAYSALLSHGWDRFFKRHEAVRNIYQLMGFEERLYYEYLDMRDCANGDLATYPNFGPAHNSWCTHCEVAPICKGIEDGDDVEDIIERRFMQKPDRKAVKHW